MGVPPLPHREKDELNLSSLGNSATQISKATGHCDVPAEIGRSMIPTLLEKV